MRLLQVFKDFAASTSIHGLTFLVQDQLSLGRRASWGLIFIAALIYAGRQLNISVICMLWGKQFGRSGRSVILFWFKLASTPSPSAATRRRSPTPRRCSRWMATLWTTLNQLVVSLTDIIAKYFIQIFLFFLISQYVLFQPCSTI